MRTDSLRKRVLVFGTFDLLHQGHRYFLTQARRFGDTLIAVVARDEFVEERKGRTRRSPWNGEWSSSSRMDWLMRSTERTDRSEVTTF